MNISISIVEDVIHLVKFVTAFAWYEIVLGVSIGINLKKSCEYISFQVAPNEEVARSEILRAKMPFNIMGKSESTYRQMSSALMLVEPFLRM